MKHKNLKSVFIRIISSICIVTLCLTFFVGCISEETSNPELEQLEKELLDAKNELKELQTEYDKELEKNKALNTENDAAKQEIEALKASNDSANKEIDTLKANNEASKQEIDSLKNSNKAAEKELDALKSSNEEVLNELEDLKNQLEDILNYVTPDSGEEKIRIYIDQGHNPTSYHNSGATGNGLYEENITFTIGRLLAGLLQFDGRFEVCLSRPKTTTVLGTNNDGSLEARVQGAKDFEADYFISLHVNSYTTDAAKGIEVHTTTDSGESYEFGSALLDGIVKSTKLNNRKMKQSPNLYVLKNATMPAALVEMGFISNPDDAKLLSENPELFAQGLYDGILNYFGLLPNITN